MINIKKLLLLGCLTVLMEASIAQSTYPVYVTLTEGPCNNIGINGAISKGALEAIVKGINSGDYEVYQGVDCNRFRNGLISDLNQLKNELGRYGCHVSINISPCPGVASVSGGGVNVLGPDQGSSFYSPDALNEILNWEKDAQKKMQALDYFYKNAERPKYISGGEKFDETRDGIRKNTYWGSIPYIGEGKFTGIPNTPLQETNGSKSSKVRLGEWSSADYRPVDLKTDFTKINNVQDYSSMANKENVERYLNASTGLAVAYLANPQDLTLLIHNQFKVVSGYDVDAIRQKLPSERTKEEQQALIDYQEFRKETLKQMYLDCAKIIDETKEKKEIDAAILAWDVYSPIGTGYIGQTNYERMDLRTLAFEDSKNHFSVVAQVLYDCNMSEGITGMHVEMYYNEVIGKYVISCAGSDDMADWVYNNSANLAGVDVPQYKQAIAIARAINGMPEDIRSKIEIVGHSLGGGIASIIGLATGLETKTFNAAKVPDKYLKEIGAEEIVNNGNVSNITRYHTSTDILTKMQDEHDMSAIGNPINLGDPSSDDKLNQYLNVLKYSENIPCVKSLEVTMTVFLSSAYTTKSLADGSVEGTATAIVAGVGSGLVTSYIVEKKGLADAIKGGLGHRMEPIVKDFINKNPEVNRRQYMKSNILNEMNKIDSSVQETILIKRDE